MLKWEKIGRSVKSDGSTTTIYTAQGKSTRYTVESRKRPIPHANNCGYWFYTSYYLIEGGSEKEFRRLLDAKAAAEEMEV